jgi:DNA repair exonuclease SbcCD nuclease subunit
MSTLNEINIVFLSDTHLGFDYPLRPKVKRRRRGNDFFRNFELVLAYAQQIKSDLVIHAGDLFYRSRVPESIIDRVYMMLANFVNHDIPIYIVPGNHERSHLPTSVFLNHPLINVFSHPRIYQKTINGIQIAIAGFPFISGDINNRIRSIIADCGWYRDKCDIKILAIHQAIEGASVGPQNFTFREGRDVISKESLPQDASVILCGHIHRQQVLFTKSNGSSQSGKIIYCGSTERTSFAEMKEKKGFYHLIFKQRKKNEWYLQKTRFIELPTRPMIDIFIESDVDMKKIEPFLVNKISEIDPDSIVRFRTNKPLVPEISQYLSIRHLSQRFPSSLNFSYSSRFYSQLEND